MNKVFGILGTVLSISGVACNAAPNKVAGDAGGDATGGGALTVRTYTSSGTGAVDIQVNSHLVVGATEAVLVDAQFLVADAQAVANMVTSSGRTLTTVLLTHAHPDHYGGLAVLQSAFPHASIVTTAGVLADFRANAPGTLAYLQSVFGDMVASTLVEPTALGGGTITLDGQTLQILELPNAGESAHAAALELPGGVLISGDLLYNDVHLQLGECHSEGWQQNIAAIRAMGFKKFYPGHGTSPVDDSVLAADTSYIAGTIPILRAAEAMSPGAGDGGDPRVGEAVGQITSMFPSFTSNFLVGFSADTFINTNKCP